jgi:predicted transcriptional regulator
MASASDLGRVLERRRAVALARHEREFEDLSIMQIAERLGRAPSAVKAYLSELPGYVELGAERRSRRGHSTDVVGIGFVHPRSSRNRSSGSCGR